MSFEEDYMQRGDQHVESSFNLASHTQSHSIRINADRGWR